MYEWLRGFHKDHLGEKRKGWLAEHSASRERKGWLYKASRQKKGCLNEANLVKGRVG